ncbi:MAG: hypothetical protein MZU97_04920 [Bacillus subtilis]|nr:hypothetical protein [Bacillus subtilis]
MSRGMTYKAAAAGLNLGGGKTVLIGDADHGQERSVLPRARDAIVQSLNGRYITAEDVNTNTKDMDFVSMETDHVVGLEGKSGNPSPMTALGAFHGIRAALRFTFDNDDISQIQLRRPRRRSDRLLSDQLLCRTQSEEDLLHRNQPEAHRTHEEGTSRSRIRQTRRHSSSCDVDVISPVRPRRRSERRDDPANQGERSSPARRTTSSRKKTSHGNMIKDKGILYAPDFVINAGGVINVYHELKTYNRDTRRPRHRKDP